MKNKLSYEKQGKSAYFILNNIYFSFYYDEFREDPDAFAENRNLTEILVYE